MKIIQVQKNHPNFFLSLFSEKILKPQNVEAASIVSETSPAVATANSTDSATKVRRILVDEPNPTEHFSHTEFLTAITHELKTPLSAILGFAAVLEDEIDNPAAKKDCLSCIAEIKQAASDLTELVHDILDVAQTSSGNFSVNLSREIDLREVVQRAVRLNYDYSLRRNVGLKVEIAENLKAVKLDAKRMKQVLTNLISNAVKYSRAGSEVKITARNTPHPNPLPQGERELNRAQSTSSPLEGFEREDNDLNGYCQRKGWGEGLSLEISVIDQGFGMTESQIKTAFEKYQTIQNPNSGSVDSFGLGLPITKQLVELQNGKIEVISEVGKGTEMKIKFPL